MKIRPTWLFQLFSFFFIDDGSLLEGVYPVDWKVNDWIGREGGGPAVGEYSMNALAASPATEMGKA